jgi:hypothetical protein
VGKIRRLDEEAAAALTIDGLLGTTLGATAQEPLAEIACAARDDRDLVHGIHARPGGRDDRMAHLVMDAMTLRSRGLGIRLFFSRPATIRSMANVKSSALTASAPRRVACSAASFTRLARSAPVEAGGERGDSVEVDPCGQAHFFTCMRRMADRLGLSGRPALSGRSARRAGAPDRVS